MVNKNNKQVIVVVEMSGNHQNSYEAMFMFVKKVLNLVQMQLNSKYIDLRR